jgi:hypothetical protein
MIAGFRQDFACENMRAVETPGTTDHHETLPTYSADERAIRRARSKSCGTRAPAAVPLNSGSDGAGTARKSLLHLGYLRSRVYPAACDEAPFRLRQFGIGSESLVGDGVELPERFGSGGR